MTGNSNSDEAWSPLSKRCPEVLEMGSALEFPGRGQRNPPVMTMEPARWIAKKAICIYVIYIYIYIYLCSARRPIAQKRSGWQDLAVSKET